MSDEAFKDPGHWFESTFVPEKSVKDPLSWAESKFMPENFEYFKDPAHWLESTFLPDKSVKDPLGSFQRKYLPDNVEGAITDAIEAIGGASSSGSNMHTVTTEPWAAIRPSLIQGIGQAQGVYFDDKGQLRTRGYVGPGDVTQTALDRMRQRGMGDPLQAASESYLTDVLGGGVNPYLSGMYDTAADKVRARLDSQFAQAGRYGSGEHEREMGSALGDLATQMYGGQYNQDMVRRMQAAQLAPDIGYQGMERQLRVGEYLDEQKRQAENWDYDQQMQALNNYIAQINQIGGQYPSQSQPVYRNRAAENLGLLSGGLGVLGQLGALGIL